MRREVFRPLQTVLFLLVCLFMLETVRWTEDRKFQQSMGPHVEQRLIEIL